MRLSVVHISVEHIVCCSVFDDDFRVTDDTLVLASVTSMMTSSLFAATLLVLFEA